MLLAQASWMKSVSEKEWILLVIFLSRSNLLDKRMNNVVRPRSPYVVVGYDISTENFLLSR